MADILDNEVDYPSLERELDRAKSKVFLNKSAGFMAPLMCSCNFYWTPDMPTAWTNGVTIGINPRYFSLLPPKTKECLIVHELRHIAYLDQVRRGDREPGLWNLACDTRLDNEMDDEGYSFENMFPVELFGPGLKTCVNHKYDGWSPEEIYDDFMKLREEERAKLLAQFQNDLSDGSQDPNGDLTPEKKFDPHQLINTVMAAVHTANMTGGAGSVPGEVEATLKRFLQPKLPWKTLLHRWFTQLAKQTHSWRRPNRRHHSRGVYLPSIQEDRTALDHLIWYFDVSQSVGDAEELRFGSEFKFVLETYKPKKITLVQFDTIIQKVEEYSSKDKYEKMEIVGRGGTSLVCVRDHILEHKPTAVVIFSDLFCTPMEKLPKELNIPILWVCVNNKSAQVNEGNLIHIKE